MISIWNGDLESESKKRSVLKSNLFRKKKTLLSYQFGVLTTEHELWKTCGLMEVDICDK